VGTAEIIVPFPIDALQRIGIDIDATSSLRRSDIIIGRTGFRYRTLCDVSAAVPVWRSGLRQRGDQVEEDKVVLLRLVMQVVGAEAEIKRAFEMRGRADFLAYLPAFGARNVDAHDGFGTAELRIAIDATGHNGRGIDATL